MVAVRNEPGTLLAVLRVFAEHGLNMSKLESRPSRERAWEYVFWVDLDGDAAEPAMAAALDERPQRHDDDRRAGQLPEPGRLTSARVALLPLPSPARPHHRSGEHRYGPGVPRRHHRGLRVR